MPSKKYPAAKSDLAEKQPWSARPKLSPMVVGRIAGAVASLP
jgi:hypothetical protein